MKKITYYELILDRSGSMADCREKTILALNTQIANIKLIQEKYPEQDIRVSLRVFNEKTFTVFSDLSATLLTPLESKMYWPGGYTALYDSIGLGISKTTERMRLQPQEADASAVVVVITDGQENASRTMRLQTLRILIEALKASGKWTFTFLGADIDAFPEASSLGITRDEIFSFDKKDIEKTFDILNSSLDEYAEYKKRGIIKKTYFKKPDTDFLPN